MKPEQQLYILASLILLLCIVLELSEIAQAIYCVGGLILLGISVLASVIREGHK